MEKSKKVRLDMAMKRALKMPVTQKIADEISEVLRVDTARLDAQTAIVYAQVAKAIKGDKAAFEIICELSEKSNPKPAKEERFIVEIKVVE